MTTPQEQEFFEAAWLGDVARTRLLLDQGANVNSNDETGWTPLHWAAYQLPLPDVGRQEVDRLIAASAAGHTAVVGVLLAANGDQNARDQSGKTPLHLAAEEGFTPVVETLLAGKADPNAKDNDGKTPLQLALEKNQDETVARLRQH